MNLIQFEAIATLISSREPTKSAARRVLVDGMENILAAREFHLSRQSVSNTVARFRAAEATIASAFSFLQRSEVGTSLNVYNSDYEAAQCELRAQEMQMSRFIRIKSPNPEYAHFLNLDLVARIEVSPQISWGEHKSPEVNLRLISVDRGDLETLKFEDREAASRWVLQHLGIEL